MPSVTWTHNKYVTDSVKSGESELVAVTFGATKEIKERRAKQIALLPDLAMAAEELIADIEIRDLKEIAGSERFTDAVEGLMAVLDKMGEIEHD